MREIVLSFLIWLGLFVPVDPLVIRGQDMGGVIGTYVNWWERVADSKIPVVIDGACISACALVFGLVPPERVCMTARASFGLHMASDGETGKASKELTDLMVRTFYPEFIQQWIKIHGPLTEELLWMYPEDLKGFYRMCTEVDMPRG